MAATNSNDFVNKPHPETSHGTTRDQSTQILLRPKPAFLNILKAVGIESDILSRVEILDGLRRYIKEKSLFDQNKPEIIRCEGDDLEGVFGLKEFNVNRVLSLIFQHTELVNPLVCKVPSPSHQLDEVDGAPMIRPSVPVSTSSQDTKEHKHTRRRKRDKETSPRERRRRKRCSSSISIVSSDGEGPCWAIQIVEVPSPASSDKLSVQSRETCWVKSSSDTYVTDTDLPVIDWDDDDDAPFTIEYEVRSETSGTYDDTEASSDDENHRGQEILVVCNDSDVEFFADYSESEEEDSDPEISSDKWICSSCGDLNSPLSRYCLCCWKERPGWLPEMSRFRRSLSAPTGLPSSSSSKSPSDLPETSSQPIGLELNERFLPAESSVASGLQSSSPSSSPPSNVLGRKPARQRLDHLQPPLSLNLKPLKSFCATDLLLSSSSSPPSDSLETPGRLLDLAEPNSIVVESHSTGPSVPCSSLLASCSRDNVDTLRIPYESIERLDFKPATFSRLKALSSSSSLSTPPIETKEISRQPLNLSESPIDLLCNVEPSHPSCKPLSSSISNTPVNVADTSSIPYDEVDGPNPPIASMSELSKKTSTSTISKPSVSNDGQRTRVSQAGECPFCVNQSSNAVLIHGKTGHQVCCYKCARKLRRRGKPCPVCRKPIQKVIKNFII